MEPLTEQQVRRSFVNCSKGEANAATLPRDLESLPWEDLELLGWRDPKAPLRGYLVVPREGRPVGVALRAADTRMSSRTAAMCLLCQTAQTGDAVSLFTARRVRTEIPPWLQDRNPAEVVVERAAELRERVHGFVDAVRR